MNIPTTIVQFLTEHSSKFTFDLRLNNLAVNRNNDNTTVSFTSSDSLTNNNYNIVITSYGIYGEISRVVITKIENDESVNIIDSNITSIIDSLTALMYLVEFGTLNGETIENIQFDTTDDEMKLIEEAAKKLNVSVDFFVIHSIRTALNRDNVASKEISNE